MGRIKFKRILAIGGAVILAGATLVAGVPGGFQDYPGFLQENGEVGAMIIVGDDAHATDVIGSIDIATGITAAFGQEPTATPGLPTPTQPASQVLEGDVIDFSKPNDLLELNEPLGDVREVLTDRDLSLLKGGVVSTTEGSTNYNQYLRFASTGTDAFNSSLLVKYGKDDDDNVGDFLFADSSSESIMWEYHLEFSEGAESKVTGGELSDLEDEVFNILGSPFAVANTAIDTATGEIELVFLGGAVADILEEGQTRTYQIDGKTYEVRVMIVSDATSEAKFEINGEITKEIVDGESDVLKDGTRIGIRDILPNEAEEEFGGDLVEFYIGATKLDIADKFTDDTFEQGVEVNDEAIEDGIVQVKGIVKASSKFELLSIKYRLEADAVKGDLYLPPGGRLTEFLDEPEGMISPNWDIIYEGLQDTDVSVLRFDPSGDEQYRIIFTNNEGLNYKVDYLDSGSGFRVGDDDVDLIWIEADNSSVFTIGEDDEFIVTDDNDETGDTHVVAYEGFDTGDSTLVFTDLYGESREFTTENTTAGTTASLIFGGNTFTAFVGPGPDFDIAVDHNNDGVIGDGSGPNDACTKNIRGLSINSTGGLLDATERVSSGDPVGPCRATLVSKGGAVVDLGVADGNSNPLGGPATPVSGEFTIGVKTLESEFDERGPRGAGGDEVIAISFDTSGGELRATIEEDESRFPFKLEEDRERDVETAMTDYGVKISIDDDSDDAQRIDLEYPMIQRGANVFVSTGDVELQVAASEAAAETGASPVAGPVAQVSVGAAKLASEIKDITKSNTIIIGGPCANKWAAQLLGQPIPCHVDFPKNTAYLQMLQHANGKIAIVVAGYEAKDTRLAARALSHAKDFNLEGSKIEVTGTSLENIHVRTLS